MRFIVLLNYVVPLLLFIGITRTAELANIKDFRMNPAKALDQTRLVKVSSLNDDNFDVQLFDEKDNIILCEDSNSVIINKIKLNTAARTGGNLYRIHEETSEDRNTWIEFKKTGSKSILGPRLPATGCLNNQHGDGGHLEGVFSKTFGKTALLDLPMGFDYGGAATPTIDYTAKVGTKVTISATYTCLVPRNKTGQMFVQPYFLEVQNPRTRTIKVKERRKLMNPAIKKASDFEVGKWMPIRGPVRLNLFDSKPILTCVTDPDSLACDKEILGDSFQF